MAGGERRNRGPSRAVTGGRPELDRSQSAAKNGADFILPTPMPTTINQAEILIALVVAAHAGVLAVRLCFSLYKA
jgi:photosystem I subunit 12